MIIARELRDRLSWSRAANLNLDLDLDIPLQNGHAHGQRAHRWQRWRCRTSAR